MTAEKKIMDRMASGQSFTFSQLWHSAGDENYRLVDRLIQKWRRKGWISFDRVGRECVWNMTDAGRQALAKLEEME